jgi:hypothetical protein
MYDDVIFHGVRSRYNKTKVKHKGKPNIRRTIQTTENTIK